MENYKEYENFCVKISKIAGNYVLNNFEGNFEIFSKDKKNNATQIAYKVDRIASGLQVTLNFENEESIERQRKYRIIIIQN